MTPGDEPTLETLLNGSGRAERSWPERPRGRIAIRIDRDGHWFYRGSKIERQSMIKLFSGLLRLENGEYVLDAPEQVLTIEVDDVPFVAVDCDIIHPGPAQQLRFSLAFGEHVTAGAAHPLVLRGARDCPQESRLYLQLNNGLEAVVHRNVFYRLADIAHTDSQSGKIGVISQEHFFALE